MPRVINVSGDIISNDYKWFYDWFEMDSTCPRDVISVLDEVNGSEDILIRINSGGGSVIAADEIYTAIASYNGNVEIEVPSIAGSAASEILAACKSKISPVGKVMIHNCSTYASGDYRAMDAASNMLKTVNQSIRNAYKAKTGLTDEELSDLMDKETWMSAEDAVKYGFVDEVMELNNQSSNSVTNQSVPTIYNSVNPLFNQDKIKELHELFIKNNLQGNKPEDIPQFLDDPKAFINNKQKEGSITNMTLEEVRAQHPEVSAEIDQLISNARTEGATEERNRMQEIDDISASVPADMVLDAKYTNPCSAQELSLRVLKDSAKKGESYMESAIKDSKSSGVEEVKEEPQDVVKEDPTDEDDKLADIAARIANRGRKAGK